MLNVSDLHVSYGPIAAVRGITLQVAEGETVGIIGPNGAGKSSTLKAIVGLLRPKAGTIELDGMSLIGDSPDAIVRRGVALVPEGRQIFGTLSVAENLRLGRAVRRNGANLDADLDRVLELFPVLKQYYRSSAGKLSGGEQQQLAIARALVLDPRLLVLDEPSLGLAPRIVELVFEALERLRSQGTTILLVEQIAARTIAFADRTYVLRTGRVVLSGTREELRQRDDLTELYMGFAR